MEYVDNALLLLYKYLRIISIMVIGNLIRNSTISCDFYINEFSNTGMIMAESTLKDRYCLEGNC